MKPAPPVTRISMAAKLLRSAPRSSFKRLNARSPRANAMGRLTKGNAKGTFPRSRDSSRDSEGGHEQHSGSEAASRCNTVRHFRLRSEFGGNSSRGAGG